ncbi:hypothetical protein WJX73_007376 [Symbiochloris irregularis]|uniref:F-box domain-containing protein n=1 Tax=Symbiochloris irregularis TaxID=706552 RepID=A0AAW1NWZ7_9CHLO
MALPFPIELQLKIFKLLPFSDQLRCESVCKTWNAFMRKSTVYEAVRVTDSQLQRMDEVPSIHSTKLCVRAFQPISRWIRRRAAIEAIQVECDCCQVGGNCDGRHRQLTAFLACLKSVPTAVHLTLRCCGNYHLFLEKLPGDLLSHLHLGKAMMLLQPPNIQAFS